MFWKYIVCSIFHNIVFLVFGFQHFQIARAVHFKLSKGIDTFKNLTSNDSCVLADVNTINNNGNLPQNLSGNAWIAPHTAWINFIGCFEGNISTNLEWKAEADRNLYIERCILRCNFSEFILTRENCFCKDEVILHRTVERNCSVDSCPGDDFALCPRNNEHTCLCEYKPINNLDVDGEGDCMIVTGNASFPMFKAENCLENHTYICNDKHKNVDTRRPLKWREAMTNCSHSTKHVTYDDKDLQIQPSDEGNLVYWIRVFRKTIFSKQGEMCLSVKIENGTATPEERPCTDRLPALYIQRIAGSDSTQEDVIANNLTEDYSLSAANISNILNDNTESNNITSTTFAGTSKGLSTNNDCDITTEDKNLTSDQSNKDNKNEIILKITFSSCLLVSLVLILVVVLATYRLKKHEKVVSETDIVMDPLYHQIGQLISQCDTPVSIYNEIETIKPSCNIRRPSSTDSNTKVENIYSHLRVGRKVRESKVRNDTYDTMANIIANSDCAYAILIKVTKSDAPATNESRDINDCDTCDLNDYDTVANIRYGQCKDSTVPIKEKRRELPSTSESDSRDDSVHLTLDRKVKSNSKKANFNTM